MRGFVDALAAILVFLSLAVSVIPTVVGCGRRDETTIPVTRPAETVSSVEGMVLLPGGEFQMGTDAGNPNEGPRHSVVLKPFYIDKTDVTVAAFARFVAATGFKTDDEKYGGSKAFNLDHRCWEEFKGVSWRCPDKPGVAPLSDEPVTQVSWNDASAFAAWAGKRLPTEAEFEYAARGGLVGKEYSWGDDLRPNGKPAANWWQGEFPDHNTAEDGYVGRSPVGKFPSNGFGLFDMTGNVWQWCSDWASDVYYHDSPRESPTGPSTGTARVIRGGSFLCAENFCQNYRVAGRSHNTPESALNNLGFRCAKDTP